MSPYRHLTVVTLIAFLLCVLTPVSAHVNPQRDHHAHVARVVAERHLVERAGAPLDNISTTSPVAVPIGTTTSPVPITSSTTTSDDTSSSTEVASTTSSSVSPISTSSSIVTSSSTSSSIESTSSPSTSTVSSSTSASSSSSTETAASSISTAETASSSTASSSTSKASQPTLIRTTTSTSQSASSSASKAASNGDDGSSGGLSKSAIIAIAVVASVVVAAGLGWTLFRKLKLRPTKRFNNRMQPVDFSPNMPDPFFEKEMDNHRSSSDATRRQYVNELDAEEYPVNNSLVPGVPEHDFTAGPVGTRPYYGACGPAEAHEMQYAGGYEAGYADLHRGPSNGAYGDYPQGGAVDYHPQGGVVDYAHGGGVEYPQGSVDYPSGGGGGEYPQAAAAPYPAYGSGYPPMAQSGIGAGGAYHDDLNTGELGRPTQGEGPYFAASQYASGGR